MNEIELEKINSFGKLSEKSDFKDNRSFENQDLETDCDLNFDFKNKFKGT